VAEPGHENGLAGPGFAGIEHVAAAMDMDQQAIAVVRWDHLGRHHEGLDAVDGHRLDLDVKLFAQRRETLDRGRRRGIGLRLPFCRGFRGGVPVRIDGRADDLLQLGADGVGNRHAARGDLARRLGDSRPGEPGRENCEACRHCGAGGVVHGCPPGFP
jgi:hypothetical protein